MVVLTALLLATASVDRLAALSKTQAWDELYLAAVQLKPSSLSNPQRALASQALTQGCQSLRATDAVLAFSLGEKAVEFKASPAAATCAAQAASLTQQLTAQETFLRAGLRQNPSDRGLKQALARFLEHERPPETGAEVATEPTGEPPASSTRFESGSDSEGRRTRSNAHFRFRYFSGQKDFGQRAQYELGVQEALDLARRQAERFVGAARTKAVDVILYSKVEFAMHHGAAAAQSIAGFYSEDSIRMNDSAEINPHNQATLVHEYVHALVDELSGFHAERLPTWLNEGLAEWVEWQHQGRDGPAAGLRAALRSASQAGRLPGLDTVTRGPLIATGNAPVAYALSGMAVGTLVRDGGMRSVVTLIRETGSGTPFAKALNRIFGRTQAELDRRLSGDLLGR